MGAKCPMRTKIPQTWTLADTYCFIATFFRRQHSTESAPVIPQQPRSRTYQAGRRFFHDYFVTHIPSSSLHPDSRGPVGPHHKLPRSASTPHTESLAKGPSPATVHSHIGVSRETTVVRIPLRSAKHHFGVSIARGMRPANEDAYQAGVIDLPSFAKRAPLSLTIGPRSAAAGTAAGTAAKEVVPENRVADSSSGDPQVFYYGVFDGHGGAECSWFLREMLHNYIQDTAAEFELQSSLKKPVERGFVSGEGNQGSYRGNPDTEERGTSATSTAMPSGKEPAREHRVNELPIIQGGNRSRIGELEKVLVTNWKDLVGGYFRRFRPTHFSYFGAKESSSSGMGSSLEGVGKATNSGVPIEEVVEYAFLRADFDFVSAQAAKRDDDIVRAEKPLNESDILDSPSRLRHQGIGGPTRFHGGSTCSIAMISTPSPTPYWHPGAPSSILVAHVGDTRILLCSTATGFAIPLTTNHHPSAPVESTRLRRYAATFVTDSFGEERMSGLANTRAFGDIQFKRIGVSAEPEIRRVELGAAEYSFLVLMTDGVSGTLTDQEVVDIIKEAKTPDQGAKDVVSFATEVSTDGDNATCLVVRLGGWERRQEGGLGSMGTKERRDWRRQEAAIPRSRRA